MDFMGFSYCFPSAISISTTSRQNCTCLQFGFNFFKIRSFRRSNSGVLSAKAESFGVRKPGITRPPSALGVENT